MDISDWLIFFSLGDIQYIVWSTRSSDVRNSLIGAIHSARQTLSSEQAVSSSSMLHWSDKAFPV